MKRREKGSESVYQRSNGSYVGEYSDVNGKRRYVSAKTKTEAKAKLKAALNNVEEGITTQNISFGDYLDQWLTSTKDTVGLRTYQRSEETVRLHIKPKLARVKLDKLTALQLDTLYRDKLKLGINSSLVYRLVQSRLSTRPHTRL